MNRYASTLRHVMSALAAIVALAAPASAQDKVKVGVFPVSSTLPYFVAVERGFFKDQNIETGMGRVIGGPPNVAALITKQIDAAAGAGGHQRHEGQNQKTGVGPDNFGQQP